MSTQAGRLAMATALPGSGSAWVAGPRPAPCSRPRGARLGQHFRFVFVTDGNTNALSSNIADYNNLANAEAGKSHVQWVRCSWFRVASTIFETRSTTSVNPERPCIWLTET